MPLVLVIDKVPLALDFIAQLSSNFFDREILQSLVSGILSVGVGAFLAIRVGLFLDRHLRARQFRSRQELITAEKVRSRHAALKGMRDLMVQIACRVEDAATSLNSNNPPFLFVDRTALDLAFQRVFATTADFDLSNRVSDFRSELEHLAKRFEFQWSHRLSKGYWAGKGDDGSVELMDDASEMIQTIKEQLELIKSRHEELISVIDRALNVE